MSKFCRTFAAIRSIPVSHGTSTHIHRVRGAVTQLLIRSRSTDASAPTVITEYDEKSRVAVLKLNKAPVNSLNLEFLADINTELDRFHDNPKCRGLILTSAVPGLFCAGLDIMEMFRPDMDRLGKFWRTFQDTCIKLYSSHLVTIAAINGHSPAGGCVLSCMCDYRMMANNQKYAIGLNETQLSFAAPRWMMDMFVEVVGHREALRALQLGHLYKPDEAVKAHLVDCLADETGILDAAKQEMGKWLKISDMGRQYTKNYLRNPTIEKFHQNRDDDIEMVKAMLSQDLVQKGLERYLENLKKRNT